MRLFFTFLMAVGLAHSVQATEVVLTSKNTVVMDQAFRASSVAQVQNKLAKLSANTNEDLYLILNSPGGSISAGQSLIDFAKSLPNKVHTITVFAASMAYLTAQHLDKRYILPSGKMMSHRARIGGLGGQVPGEANTRLSFITSIVDEIFASTAKRVGVSFEEYMGLVYDELWLTANQAVKTNHADEVIVAKCDKSLSGTYVRTVRSFFGNFKVTFSKCPLINGPLKIHTSNTTVKKYLEKKLNHSSRKNFTLTL